MEEETVALEEQKASEPEEPPENLEDSAGADPEESALDDEDDEEDEEEPEEQVPEILVANVNGTYVRFKNLEAIPSGSKVYSQKEDLQGQTKDQLETLYSYVKKVDKKAFKDHAAAVENVWYTFQNLPFFDPKKHLPRDVEADKKRGAKASGKKADAKSGKGSKADEKSYVRKRDTNKFVMKNPTEKSKKAVESMAPQARVIVELMVAGGKTEYTEAELREIIEKNKERLRTRQNSWRIFQYYRSQLISADVFIQK